MLKLGPTAAVATAAAPCEVIVSGRLVPVIVSGFELNATTAYSAPVVPPARQIPVPVMPAKTLPTLRFVGERVEQAAVALELPAVRAKNVTREVPDTLAEIDTVPGEEPKVTRVFA
jgi:hypothetical protein